jgi:ParB family chromosome partitioning protein
LCYYPFAYDFSIFYCPTNSLFLFLPLSLFFLRSTSCKSRSHVANTLRLLNLPEAAKALVRDGAISAGHARALLAVDNPEAIARRIVAEGLTVRDVEALGQAQQGEGGAKGGSAGKKPKAEKDANTRALEKTLCDALGMTVEINGRGERGEIRIRYESLDQLDAVCRMLG